MSTQLMNLGQSFGQTETCRLMTVTSKESDRTTYLIHLKAETGLDQQAVLRSLRHFLKAALRSYRLRCTIIKPLEPKGK